MPRSKTVVPGRARRRKVLKAAKGNFGGRRIYAETSGRPQYEPTRVFYERLGFTPETQLKDFYAPGEDKVFYVRVLKS